METDKEKKQYGEERFRDFPAVSLDGLKVLGEGANSTVYQLDDFRSLKVLKEAVPFEKMAREQELARLALKHGVPCIRPFGFALADGKPAQISELASVMSYLKLIKQDPSNLERYMNAYVGIIRQLHAINGEALKDFPRCQVPGELKEKADRLDSLLPQSCRGCLRKILESIDKPEVLTHGDIQPKNVRFGDKGPVFIDLETLSTGPFVLDIGALYRTMFADWIYGGQDSNTFLGLSAEQSMEFWNRFTNVYFDGVPEAEKEKSLREAEAIGHILAVAKMQKRQIRGSELENGVRKLVETVDAWKKAGETDR